MSQNSEYLLCPTDSSKCNSQKKTVSAGEDQEFESNYYGSSYICYYEVATEDGVNKIEFEIGRLIPLLYYLFTFINKEHYLYYFIDIGL